jgi:hypothetical protein
MNSSRSTNWWSNPVFAGLVVNFALERLRTVMMVWQIENRVRPQDFEGHNTNFLLLKLRMGTDHARISPMVVPGFPHHETQRGVRSMVIVRNEDRREACSLFTGKQTARFGVEMKAAYEK